MIKYKKSYIALIRFISIFLFQSLSYVCAQEPPTFAKTVDFLPPAPNAAAIIKYGDIAVNKNTGTPNISIPLFTVKGNKIATNISLGYSSNGIKVDEVASRVGMGWAINAGGVITRTLRGMPDESNTRHYPYAQVGTNWGTYNYMKRIAQSQNVWGYSGGFDAEPDLFNFSVDGYIGSFVFNGNGFAQVNKSGIRIEKNTGTSTSWSFKITTTNGVVYFFGGDNAIEKTKRTQTCGRNYSEPIPTAWYLKEILHPNGEKILLNYTPFDYEYETGVTQTMYSPYIQPCAAIPTSKCVNFSKTFGVLLTSIESPGKSLLEFVYTNRQDCQDKLLSTLTLKNPVEIISSINLNYTTVSSNPEFNNELGLLGFDKISYLSNISENSSDNNFTKKHYFSYITPEERPSRLSFSQDHWGYFNGRKNTTFTPKIEQTVNVNFPEATANKEPDFIATQKGMLQKIVFPTGGTTTIFYEPNLYDDGVLNTYTTKHNLSCDVTGTGNWEQQSRTRNFTAQTQMVQLQIECKDNSGNGNFDPIHNKGSIELTNLDNNVIVNITPNVYVPGYNNVISCMLEGGNYQLKIMANGSVVTTSVILKYFSNNTNSVSSENIAGGVRVQKIVTTNEGQAPMVKKYFYGTLENLNRSSLAVIKKPIYFGVMKKIVGNGENGLVCEYNTLNSSSINNLGYYNNNIVSYNSIVESNGENFEGGGIESQFYVNTDGYGQVLWNKDIINAPYTNFSSFYNARPRSETIVKKMTDGVLKPIKKTVYSYENEPAGENTIYGYTVVEKVPDYNYNYYDTTCIPEYDPGPFSCYSHLNRAVGLFDMVRFDVFSSFVHPKSQTETIWDENGYNPIVSVKNTFYENLNNFQLTKTKSTNTKGQLIQTSLQYPNNFMNQQVYEDMVNANQIDEIVNSKTEIINQPISSNIPLVEQQIDYSNIGISHFAPTAIKKATKGLPLEIEGTIDQYDALGNILQFTNKTGIVSAVIWGYNSQYPVAQIVGTSYANAINQLSVTVNNLQMLDGAALKIELNRIRLNIPTASVTTYTYKPSVGVTSITDPNNKTNTYDYDSFNRLITIKDQDGNYVKKNEYVYVTPNPNAGPYIYLNQPINQEFVCSNCLPGFVGNSINYNIPFGKYYSHISQQDADSKAQTEMTTYGQENANKLGICSNAGTCTQPGYKFLNCACVLGQKICEYSQPDPNNANAWFAHFHYLWSDGSTSPSFTEYISNCSGIDKKFLNCICETGTKECIQSVNNGNNTYTITYKYKWSDNTYSQPVTETITCTGVDKKMVNCICETGFKVYTSSVYCGANPPPGCCANMWQCTYHYLWSDGSISGDFTECSHKNCSFTEQ